MSQKYLATVVLSSIVIMVYQGIANSDLGIVSQLTYQNGNKWAGPLLTSLLFTGSALGSLYNKYLGKYPFKITLFVGSFGYTLFIGLGLIFLKLNFSTGVLVVMFIGAFIAGLLSSIFYTSQFNYINTLSKIDNREVKYFGINVGLAQSSNILGNFISSQLIQPLGQFLAVLVMEIIILVTSFFFLFFKQPTKSQLMLLQQLTLQNESQSQSQNENEDMRSSVISQEQEKRSQQVGHVKNQTPQQDNLQRKNDLPTQNRLISLWRVCSCGSFSGIIISFVYCGLSIVLYRSFDEMDDTSLNHLSFILFIFDGIGEFLGGLFMVIFSIRIKEPRKILVVCSTLFMISLGLIYIGCQIKSKQLIAGALILTGFSDCTCYALALVVSGPWKETGVKVFQLSQCMGVSVSTIFMVFVPFWASVVWMGVFFIFVFVGMIIPSNLLKIGKQKN